MLFGVSEATNRKLVLGLRKVINEGKPLDMGCEHFEDGYIAHNLVTNGPKSLPEMKCAPCNSN